MVPGSPPEPSFILCSRKELPLADKGTEEAKDLKDNNWANTQSPIPFISPEFASVKASLKP
uniref:Uncharacterized protein n=1 Tax=Rhizophora mucronata TaxID=61149 RepID=A0A2P2K9G0_RHIMU